MAYVLSSVSGNLISAASAGYAPTNSADVSAIASAYQVVSATATQLYAGTAYITSVNAAPISAARAGNAANASMANSAYYDGTGRLISSLPDEATVSSIASAYAESAASGKLDKTAQVVSATGTELYNGTYYLTSVNDNQLSAKYAVSASSATAAFYARYDRRDGVVRYLSSLPGSAEVSAIAYSYVESGVSSKQDTLSFAYNTADQISSINGSALGGMDEAAVSGIASAYAESAVSSKADSSALSSYALSADVSGTVDLVSTQSANWGGSALALSAGPGVSLTKSGNVLVAGLDETLLWSGSLAAVDNATLTASSSPTDYRSIKFVFEGFADNQRAPQELYFSGCDKEFDIMPIGFNGQGIRLSHVRLKFAGTVGTFSETVQYLVTTTISTSVDRPYLRAIYGINRTAEA